MATTGTYAPEPAFTGFDTNGKPLAAGKLYTYTAGTSTPVATYSDVALATPNANPIILDSAGRCTIFLTPGVSYKFVLNDSTNTLVWTRDNIAAIPGSVAGVDLTGTAGEALTAGQAVYLSDGSGGKTAGLWYKADSANTYSSTTPEVGMVPTSIASGASGTIRISGSVTGLSSLAVGATYYVGTAGAITSTAPANARILGVADTTSSLVLAGNPAPVVVNADNAIDDFRLTLTTGLPVTSADVLAATTVFCTPYRGNRISLYNASGVATVYTSAEFSIAVPATTSQMYDVFCFLSGATPTLELLAWTNDTTRATALVLTTTGAYTKSGDLTRRYLGSFRTTTVSGQTEDSAAKRYLWNYYNRVRRPLLRVESTATWTYTTATFRQANATTANQVEVVIGVAEAIIDLLLLAQANTGTALVGFSVGFGEDSTSALSASSVGGTAESDNQAISMFRPLTARLVKYPAVGRHFYAWLEASAALGTTTWFGTPGVTASMAGTANGISGWIEG